MKPFFSFHKIPSILLLLASLLISITLGAWNMGSLTNIDRPNNEPIIISTDK